MTNGNHPAIEAGSEAAKTPERDREREAKAEALPTNQPDAKKEAKPATEKPVQSLEA